MNPWMIYFALVLIGFLLIGTEIYVPGGILGSIGLVCLGIATVQGFKINAQVGWVSLLGILFFGIAAAVFWLKVFPHSSAGKRLTLSYNGKTFQTRSPVLDNLKGKSGRTRTALRPAGVAQIEGKRLDVVADDGIWIDTDAEVEVSRVSGSRIYVQPRGPQAEDA